MDAAPAEGGGEPSAPGAGAGVTGWLDDLRGRDGSWVGGNSGEARLDTSSGMMDEDSSAMETSDQ